MESDRDKQTPIHNKSVKSHPKGTPGIKSPDLTKVTLLSGDYTDSDYVYSKDAEAISENISSQDAFGEKVNDLEDDHRGSVNDLESSRESVQDTDNSLYSNKDVADSSFSPGVEGHTSPVDDKNITSSALFNDSVSITCCVLSQMELIRFCNLTYMCSSP